MKTVKLHFLNTIWSDASILQVNDHFGMIDSASKFYFPMIEEYFKENNITHLDFLFLTHFHSDHYGNIINLLNTVKIDTVYLREYSRHDYVGSDGSITSEEYIKKESDKEEEIKALSKEKSNLVIIDENLKYIDFEGIRLHLYNQLNIVNYLYNKEDSIFYHKNLLSENNMSVSIYFEYLNHHVYMGGDLTDNNSDEPLVCYQNRRVLTQIKEEFKFDHLDIYKTTHHGGGGSNNQTSFEIVKPTYAIITNTNKWLDNWPTRNNILNANPSCMILQTDHRQYVFDLSNKVITCKFINKESLFLTLQMN